jgi:putative transposase
MRQGVYFPGFLEPRRTIEKAIAAVTQEACIQGVPKRSVDDLFKVKGMTVYLEKPGISPRCKPDC